MSEEETREQKIDRLLAHLDKIHEPKKWYQRTFVQGVLTHWTTVALALSLGYAIHIITGAPVPAIEAKNAAPSPIVASAPPAAVANAETVTVEIPAPVDTSGAAASSQAVASASTKPKHPPTTIVVAVSPAAAPPPATTAAAAMPAAAPTAATAR